MKYLREKALAHFKAMREAAAGNSELAGYYDEVIKALIKEIPVKVKDGYCPYCGHAMMIVTRYCGNCGQALALKE